MKKILFIVDAYGASMSANGACIKEVGKVFLANEYEVHIMGVKHYREVKEEIVDGFFVHRVSCNFYTKIALYAKLHGNGWKSKLAFLLQKLLGIRTLLLLPVYPVRQPFSCLRYRNVAEKLQNRFGFDLVISCFWPIESLFAGKYLKKKFGIRFCTYFVDTLTDNLPKHHFLKKSFMDNKGYKYERKFFESSDLILNLKSHEQNFLDEKYDLWRQKMKNVDIPHLKNRTLEASLFSSIHKEINIVYTGGIRKNLIQPVLEILKNIAGIKLHLYGPNNLIVPNLEFIVKHGMVNRDKALEAQETSNVLLSMGNKDSAFVPSKIFEYISTGKKIIHFCFSQQDSSIPYYRKYKNCLIINVNDDLNENTQKIKEFFAIPEKRITYSELKDTFPECEPQYTYDTITDFLRLNK